MKIRLAGAGAGKTSHLANVIFDEYRMISGTARPIYVMAYSNLARNIIFERLQKKFHGNIPRDIHFSTIHNFLNHKIIRPYFYCLFNIEYHGVSMEDVSGKYRGYNLKRINDSGLLHVSQFSERAKWVLFQKSGESKKTKSNRKVITDLITDNIGKVYIDEAQDIDKDMSIVLKILDSLGVEIYLTGDLNQDLSSRGGLAGLCEERKYEVNHENHRCPENHVKLANVFLSTEFEQSALSTSIGSLNYCLEPEIRDVANLVSKYQLTYVNKSNLRFRKAKKNEDNLETILQSILESALCVSKKDKESKRIFDDSVYNYVYRTKIEKRLNSSNLIQYVDGILKTFDIKNDRRTFARLREALKKYENSVMTDGIEVSTIMGIKGDEADDCLFIMSTDLFSYLSQESSAANKMKCALYVGLTRARKNLTLLLTTEVTKKYSATAISDIMKKLGIQKLPIN